MLTGTQIKKLEETIERKIRLTRQAINDYRDMAAPVAPDDSIGRLTRMDAINNKSVTEAALREAEARLIRLNEAIQRLHQPDFEICVGCKKPIPFDRLKAMPDARRCVGCSR